MTLAALYPHLIQEFIEEKNPGVDLASLKSKSNKNVWWRCSQGHAYQTKVCHRTRPNARCPYCTGRKLSPERSLMVCNPKLASEFHPTKNGSLTAADVFISSGKRYWWLCELDSLHEWQSTVDNRQRGTGCPYCAGKKTMAEDSFAHRHPELLQEWDFDLNRKDPYSLALKSNHRAQWKCQKKEYHVWSATIASRTDGDGCPYCSGHRLHEKDSAYFQLPEKVLNEFIQELNPTIDLKKSSIYSEKGIVWKCTPHPGHKTWKARLKTRLQGKHNCPECEPHSTKTPFEKSVAFLHPHLVKEWHPDNIFSPNQLKARSGRLVKWVCQIKKHHTYEMIVAQKVEGRGCPKCRNAPTLPELRLLSELSLFFSPLLHHNIGKDKIDIYLEDIHVAIEWDSHYYHEKRLRADIKKTESLLKKGIKVIRIRDDRLASLYIDDEGLKIIAHLYAEFNYKIFKEILKAFIDWKIGSRADLIQALSREEFANNLTFEDLKNNRGRHIAERSLRETHPEAAKFWHPKKNGQLGVHEVMAFSHERCWWQCPACEFEWCERIANITKRHDVCTRCSKQTAGPQYNLLKAYPKIAQELIGADPTKITPHSGERHKWKCAECTYEWENTVNGRTGKGKNGCPRCAGKVLTFENSIAGISFEAVEAWDYQKNTKKPEDVFPGTQIKYFFKCSCGMSIEKKPHNFIWRNQRRCSACSRKRK